MVNFSVKLQTSAVSGLLAQQAVIATTGNNIANVNTPGYVRRQAVLENRAGSSTESIQIGDGVQLGGVRRLADEYLERLTRETLTTAEKYDVQNQYLNRIQSEFGLTDNDSTIGKAFTNFLTAVDDLSYDPSNIPLRSNFIDRGTDLVNALKSTYDAAADIQQEADDALSAEVSGINNITTQIASLNTQITQAESGGGEATDARDTRDILLKDLAGKIGFTSFEDSSGQVTVSLSNGMQLVSGSSSKDLIFARAPSFITTPPPSLNGGTLGYLVVNLGSSAAPAHVDLTQTLQNSGGKVGGLLDIRGYNAASSTTPFQANGYMVQIASRVEAFTERLLTTVNATYFGGDENSGVAGNQSTAGDINGTNPAVYGLFSLNTALTIDADGDGVAESSDIATLGLTNYTSYLTFNVSAASNVAAARDLNATQGATSFVAGDNQNLVALGTTLRASQSFSTGSYSFTGTFSAAYQDMVSYVGNTALNVGNNKRVADAQASIAQNNRDEKSSVSLDEEFATLIQAQRSFSASARLLKVSDELLQQIVQLV
jgi:flagellar hook-associated protein 1 FlgK